MNIPGNSLIAIVTLFLIALATPVAAAPAIDFLCSWDDNEPITISVDPATKTATRSDGGKPYSVIKLTKWGVWLAIDDPSNVATAVVQMIVRAEAVRSDKYPNRNPPGGWTDITMPITEAFSPITGGKCWEQSSHLTRTP